MAAVWKKTLTYLGLVEDDDYDDFDELSEVQAQSAPVRRLGRTQRAGDSAMIDSSDGAIRTISPGLQAQSTAIPSGAIHRAEPKRFNDVREVGDRFRQGIPVIMNLQSTDDAIARRLVDFASGLVYAIDGTIETVANRVYLLTPANIEVSAEERERLREGGFYNQF